MTRRFHKGDRKLLLRHCILDSTSNAKHTIDIYIAETDTTELRKLRHKIIDIFIIET